MCIYFGGFGGVWPSNKLSLAQETSALSSVFNSCESNYILILGPLIDAGPGFLSRKLLSTAFVKTLLAAALFVG